MIVDWVEFRKFALSLTEDGYIPIFGEFVDQLAEIANECIWKLKKSGKKQVTLLIDSTGGMNTTFASIKATMLETGLEFRGLVMGKAYSNGFNILQQCDHRAAVKDAYLMFHWGTQRLSNSELAALISGEMWPIEAAIEAELMTAQTVSERTGTSVDQLTVYALYERYFIATQALKENFIDEVISDLPPKLKEKLKKDVSTE